jgi:PAS domain S-box-containing protein
MEEAPPARIEKQSRPFPFLVLALSLLFTCGATYYLASINRKKNLARFTNVTLQTEARIRDALNTYTALLRGGAGLFSANNFVGRKNFDIYYERLRIPEFYSGVFGFGFAPRIDSRQRPALIAEMRAEGLTNFTIWPDQHQTDCFPIIYLEPMNWRNQRAIGYDMFTEPIRHAAMEQAIQSGFAISGKVTLVQENGEDPQAGFLMYATVYRNGELAKTAGGRIEDVKGFVYSPFRADDLFEHIFRGTQRLQTSLEVYDGDEILEKNLLHRSGHLRPKKPHFTLIDKFEIEGHTWTLVHRTTPEFEATLDRANVFWVFIAGVIISFILLGVTLVLSKAQRRAEKSRRDLLRERERLRASEEMYRTISETAADGIITIDSDSKILTVNRAAERIFGYEADEMRGKELTMLMPQRMRAAHLAGLARFLKTGVKGMSWEGAELPGLHKNGSEIPLEISFGQVEKNGRRIFTGVIRDIRERKKTEEQIRTLNRELEKRVADRTAELQEANHQMETFVYSIAHDLRAPLRAMRGFAHALGEDYHNVLDEHGRDFTRRIIASAKFMDELINDLLAFSRVTRAELGLGPVHLDLVVKEVLQQLAAEIQEKKATIEIREPLPDVRGHEATIRQVVTNLILNAIKFVAPDVQPKIVIRATDSKTHWRIWIEDNGIGIAASHIGRIFGIFERLHGGTYPGTGIGLAIVRKGIERMNGHVGVETELGKGSRFWFELPKTGD